MANGTDRTGLYIMVFLILMNSCDADSRTTRIEQKVNAMQPCVAAPNINAPTGEAVQPSPTE